MPESDISGSRRQGILSGLFSLTAKVKTMSPFEKKLAALDQINVIYDEFMATLDLACEKDCAHCCTDSVSLTTLEGYKIVERLIADGKSEVIEQIQTASVAKRFKPKITTNQLADLCIAGIEPPDEERPEKAHPCPLLKDRQCPLYIVRPFGCRCLVSRHDCGEKGYAEMDDFVLSVNTVFLQTIEHLDLHGCTGNLIDVLMALYSEENRRAYRDNLLTCHTAGLIPNRPLKVLMVPPEHRESVRPILQKLQQISL